MDEREPEVAVQDTIAAPAGAAARAYGLLDRGLEHVCAALILTAAAIACLQVFCRYALNASLAWPEEVALWAFGWAVFLGMAVMVGRDGHVAIDVVSRFLPTRWKVLHGFFIRVVVAATSVMLILQGLDYSGRIMQVAPATQWSLKYLFVAASVGGALNLVYLLRPRAGPAWSGVATVLGGVLLYYAVRHGAGMLYGSSASAVALMIVGLGLIFLEVPIAFALAFGAFAAFSPLGSMMLMIVPQNMSASLNSFTLLAIPFFIMAAAVMNAGGITAKLVGLAVTLVGHLRGGLGQANVVTNTLLAGVSGSSSADASAVAKLMVPEMEKRGYDRAFSCALTSASSTLANLIPPGLGLIIYAALASVSVGALFVATIVPGLLAASALALTVYVISRRGGYGGDVARSTGAERLSAFGAAVPALLLPLVIVGGVRFGAFTATEAGAIAFVFAIFCGIFVYRRLTLANFSEAVRESAFDTVAVTIIIAAAAPFAWVLAAEQVPQKIAAALGALSSNQYMLLLLINLFLLFVGLFMEMIAALAILVPILVPIIIAAGYDPVTFGIVLILNLVIGALTPPMGMLVFITARVGKADVTKVFWAVLPFVAALLTVLALVTYIPALTTAPLKMFGP